MIQAFRAEDRSAQATSENLGLRPGLVEAAVAYYADNREAVDEWIEANHMMMEEAAAAFDRQQAVKGA